MRELEQYTLQAGKIFNFSKIFQGYIKNECSQMAQEGFDVIEMFSDFMVELSDDLYFALQKATYATDLDDD